MLSRHQFSEAYTAHVDRLYGYFMTRLNSDQPLAEDLLSETFFRALRSLSSFDETRGNVTTWLFSIASHLIIDHYRSHREHDPIENFEEIIAAPDNVHKTTINRMEAEQVLAHILKLPDTTREIILLHVFEEMTFAEIATIFDIEE
jgi:RNA polymerase sigma-70 factor (ECF subfamily)